MMVNPTPFEKVVVKLMLLNSPFAAVKVWVVQTSVGSWMFRL